MNETASSSNLIGNVYKRLGIMSGNQKLSLTTSPDMLSSAATPTPASVRVRTSNVPEVATKTVDASKVDRPDGDGQETRVERQDGTSAGTKSGVTTDVATDGQAIDKVVAGVSATRLDADGQETSAEKADVVATDEEATGDKQKLKKTPNDFIFGKMIGEGSFSTVYLAKDVYSDREFAVKVCDKRHIFREKKQKYIKQEKEVLNYLNDHSSPLFVKLYCTFQDPERLYFVLTYAKNGELLPYINKVGSFDEECSRFYTAEIVLALEHLHRHGIVHRDLKPENILLNEKMHILITDFGSARILEARPPGDTRPQRRNSFVGTAQYVSPDVLNDQPATTSSDLWALGVIIYQMVSGLPPFRTRIADKNNDYNIFGKIQALEFSFPDGFNPKAKDIVEKLLKLDSTQRLGAGDTGGTYTSLRNHEFLHGLDWDNLVTQTPPPIYPYLPGTPGNEELRSQYRVPSSLEPGFGDRHVSRLLSLDLYEDGERENESPAPVAPRPPQTSRRTSIMNFSPEELRERLKIQEKENVWNPFVLGNLILKNGIIDKRKGLFSKRRMLLLTTGPHLYYVDPVHKVMKGEIPWSPQLRPEPKNFKTFFVHTPNRTYYLEDPEGYALEWCRVIDEVRRHTYGQEV